MSDLNDLWEGIEPNPNLVQRDNASKLRFVADRLSTLQGKPYLADELARTLHDVAHGIDTERQVADKDFASVTAARKALQDLRSALPQIGRDVDLKIKLTRTHQRVRRELGDARRAAAKERARYESTVKEARRQAARAKAAEAKLAELQGEQR